MIHDDSCAMQEAGCANGSYRRFGVDLSAPLGSNISSFDDQEVTLMADFYDAIIIGSGPAPGLTARDLPGAGGPEMRDP